MLYPTPPPRPAPLVGDGPAGLDPAAAARHALARLRPLLRSFTPPDSGGVREGALRLRESLSAFLDRPEEEAERLFFLGWLRWLGGEGTRGVPLFEACAGQAEALVPVPVGTMPGTVALQAAAVGAGGSFTLTNAVAATVP